MEERKRDHYSHWTLRLAFSATEELRGRFAKLETKLFELRMNQDDARERREFIEALSMSWETVTEEEKKEFGEQLRAATGFLKRDEEENWFKVDWERVPELVQHRKVLLRRGKAFVHVREQTTMVTTEFTRQLENGLELAARALPRMDEDDRLSPILNHLSKSFTAPEAAYSADASSISDMADIRAETIDPLSKFFPLCMQNLHRELRKNNHLKHYGRLQYTLFLKGIGMDMNECIAFWRKSFKLMTDGELSPFFLPHTQSNLLQQTSSRRTTCTTSATPTATWAGTATSAAAAIRPTIARDSSPMHRQDRARVTAARTGPSTRTTWSHCCRAQA